MIDDLVGEKAITEVRHLHDNRLRIERLKAGAVYGVLVRASDEPLGEVDIVVKHADSSNRPCRQHAGSNC